MLKIVIVPVDCYTKITKHATKTFLKIHPVCLSFYVYVD